MPLANNPLDTCRPPKPGAPNRGGGVGATPPNFGEGGSTPLILRELVV